MGASFVVIPSSNHVLETTSDDADQSDVNVQRVNKKLCFPFEILLNSVIITLQLLSFNTYWSEILHKYVASILSLILQFFKAFPAFYIQ